MLESMKHCVAMGGAAIAVAGPAGAAAGAAAGGAPGTPPTTAGGAGVMLSAFAATGGNSNPVPVKITNSTLFKCHIARSRF